MDKAALDAALLRAHERGDRSALVSLYTDAAKSAGAAEAFYLTHAYVFALESGDIRAPSLRARLVDLGAEIPG